MILEKNIFNNDSVDEFIFIKTFPFSDRKNNDSKTIILEDESYEIEISSDKAIDLTFVIQNNTNVLVNIQSCPSLHNVWFLVNLIPGICP